jgi:hypothetical protein
MAGFFEVDQDLIAAAAERSPPLPEREADQPITTWIAQQSQTDLQHWIRRLLGGNALAARAETLALIRAQAPIAAWPLAEPTRTWAHLCKAAAGCQARRAGREIEAAKMRRKRPESLVQ